MSSLAAAAHTIACLQLNNARCWRGADGARGRRGAPLTAPMQCPGATRLIMIMDELNEFWPARLRRPIATVSAAIAPCAAQARAVAPGRDGQAAPAA
jgi:hypothetical protein